MSWDPYIDNLQQQCGAANCDKACIIGIDGGAAWTGSGGNANALRIKPQEGSTIADCFKRKDFGSFMTNGIFVEGVKYQFLREQEGRLVLGKKKDHGSVTLQRSKTAVVIAHCPEGGQQGNTNQGVNVIAEYLENSGY